MIETCGFFINMISKNFVINMQNFFTGIFQGGVKSNEGRVF